VTATRRIAVVITHYKSPDELARSLRSLLPAGGGVDLDVVVADSEAQPGVGEIVAREFPTARYLPFDENVGYARLVNAGLKATDSEYVLVLNADVEVDREAIAGLARHLDENPRVGVVGPELTYRNGAHQTTAFAFYRPFTILARRTPVGRTRWGRRELARFELKSEVPAALAEKTPLDVDWLMGAAMLVRRDLIERIGGVEERYFLYFEDVDWCLRSWHAGYKVVYLPTVRATHGWARASKKGGIVGVLTNPLTRRHIAASITFFRLHGLRTDRGETGQRLSALA
jgi:N-acetylglucosaminyl-diphospho-decaprenol L-rhamnosyltransferase